MLPRLEGRLGAERVTVAAGPRTGPVLRGVSFTVAPGRVLAVLGPSGAGKTTLARTIVGALAPLDGRLCLDGVRICAWDRNELGRHIGYLPQDASLLEGTVRETIARGDPQASLADVIAAARWAGAHELVLGLPQGYETRLGELGTVLPPGHRRRIALARALFGEPRLLVLDEPDANLDGDGEVALVRALAEAKARGITVVVVTNRPSLLRAVDDVLVLRDGVAERFGPRDAVISQLIQPHPVAAQAASR
jgi:ATP-binding cassette subfamily C protein/ATP-binding cassette subfamily C protein EexD